MSTTVDDLIHVKDTAVDACRGVVAAWERGDLAGAADGCQAAVELADDYDEADENEECSSLDDLPAARRRARARDVIDGAEVYSEDTREMLAVTWRSAATCCARRAKTATSTTATT
jgi:hypothetical protein